MNKQFYREISDMDKAVKRFKKDLTDAKIPYTERLTKSMVTISPNVEGYNLETQYVLKGFTGHELNFIKKVKRHFSELEKPPRLRPYSERVLYYGNTANLDFGDYPGHVEIDVNAAYWECAYKLGYLPETLYREGKDTSKVRKQLRLVSLGALAKRVQYFEYNREGELMNCREDICDLEIFWDNITFSFGQVMERVKRSFGRGVIGYWVDAFFVSSDIAPLVKLAFREQGYDVKIIPLLSLEVIPGNTPGKGFIRREIEKDGIKEVKDLPEFWVDGKERGGGVKQALAQLEMKLDSMLKKK